MGWIIDDCVGYEELCETPSINPDSDGRPLACFVMSGEPCFVVVRYDDDGFPYFLSKAFAYAEKIKGHHDASFAASPWNAVRFHSRSEAQWRADRIAGATVEIIDVARRPAPPRPEGK